MTARAHVVFGLAIARASKQEKDAWVAGAVRMLQLEQFLGRWQSRLSGRQRQRVAMGRDAVFQIGSDIYMFFDRAWADLCAAP
jgi:multiple sugar transport system ATP-binding protein